MAFSQPSPRFGFLCTKWSTQLTYFHNFKVMWKSCYWNLPLETILANPSTQTWSSVRASWPGLFLLRFWRSPWMETPPPLQETFPLFRHPHSKRVISAIQIEPMCFNMCLLPLALSLGSTGKSLAPFSLHPPTRYLWTIIRYLFVFLSAGWTVPALSDSLCMRHTQFLTICMYLSLWTVQLISSTIL